MKIVMLVLALGVRLYAQAPAYTAAGIVNGANFLAGPLAPNMIVSLFGTNLSWEENGVAMGPQDMIGDEMPKKLGGVQVYVSGYPAHLYYVSKTQVNLVIPCYMLTGPKDIWLARDGWAGDKVRVDLQSAAPALFTTVDGVPVVTHADYSVVTKDTPARADEPIVLWATGLGCIQNQDTRDDGVRPREAQWLCNMDQFSVWIGGTPVDPSLIQYAGAAPGYPGLYQVNVKMPHQFPADPEIRLAMGDSASAPGVILPAR